MGPDGRTDTEGDTSFLAELPGAPNSPIVMSSATTLDLSMPNSLNLVALGSLADASSGVTGQKVLLGGNTLATGLNNSNTTFSGVISGVGGSLQKQGAGTFSSTGPTRIAAAPALPQVR